MEANAMSPDQTAPVGAVWSGSILFAICYVEERADDKSRDWQVKGYYFFFSKFVFRLKDWKRCLVLK